MKNGTTSLPIAPYVWTAVVALILSAFVAFSYSCSDDIQVLPAVCPLPPAEVMPQDCTFTCKPKCDNRGLWSWTCEEHCE